MEWQTVKTQITAPSGSGSALFAYVIMLDTLVFEIFGHLPYNIGWDSNMIICILS